MSRSYRRPYASVTTCTSAKDDKRLAARGVRRKQNQWLRTTQDFEDNGLVPHRLECSWNEVCGWKRDGKQRFIRPSGYEHTRYSLTQLGLFRNHWDREFCLEHFNVWPPLWHAKITRK